jgi:hypothetical protein
MAKMGKYISLFLVVILAISILIFVNPSDAQSIPKPSVPEFTVRSVDNSYDVPTTTSIDPYTGKTITNQGYHVEKISTELAIKNQPFTPFKLNVDGDNKTINLFYNIHIKGHYSPNWNYYQRYNGSSDGNLIQDYGSSYTTVPINEYMPKEGALDIQVQAMVGYEVGVISSVPGAPGTARVIRGENSGWSNIQTVTVPTSSFVTTTPTSTELPNVGPTSSPIPSYDGLFMVLAFVAIAILVFSLIAILLYVRHLKRSIPKK